MSTKNAVFAIITALLFGAGIGSLVIYQGIYTMKKDLAFKLSEPLLFLSPDGSQHHLLPAGATLFFQKGYDEGHAIYAMEVVFKGKFEAERITDLQQAEPLWVDTIYDTDLKELVKNYPISKDDLVRILKARKMTRDDLADIVRDWKD